MHLTKKLFVVNRPKINQIQYILITYSSMDERVIKFFVSDRFSQYVRLEDFRQLLKNIKIVVYWYSATALQELLLCVVSQFCRV